MRHSKQRRTFALGSLLLASLCASCAGKGQQVDGEALGNSCFAPYRADMGAYPSSSVLSDPYNPFAHVSVDALANGTTARPALKWSFGTAAPPAVAFYAWATVLARAPSGENQYYTATWLHTLFTDANVRLCSPDQAETVRQMAVNAYTAVLVYFPQDYARNADGTLAWDFATPSVQAIVALGGTIPQGWQLVTGSDGNPRAVRI